MTEVQRLASGLGTVSEGLTRMKIRDLGGYWLTAVLSVTSLAAANSDLRLVEAVEAQAEEAARALLQEDVDVNAAQPDGATALHWAAHWDNLDLAGLLIGAGADVTATNDLGVPPLSLACANGSLAMVETLLGAGANPSAALSTGETALMAAAHTGKVDVVSALLAYGADVNAHEDERRQTALMRAVAEGHSEVVEVLIENGADVHARSTGGFTPLLFAARAGHLDSARMLFAAGADLNEATPDGHTALLVASASMMAISAFEYSLTVTPSGHEALAVFLLDNGADPASADNLGTTALHAAVQTGKLELVTALLAHGANPNAQLVKSPPPLAGDFVSYRNYVGATPFWLAAAAREPVVEMMRLLVAAGADPNLAAVGDTTPLMAGVGMVQYEARMAAEDLALQVVDVAVQLGADVNAVNQRGQTALHGAARYSRNTIIRFLVEHGATPDVQDGRGRTPLNIAEGSSSGRDSTAPLLRALGGGTDTDAQPDPRRNARSAPK